MSSAGIKDDMSTAADVFEEEGDYIEEEVEVTDDEDGASEHAEVVHDDSSAAAIGTETSSMVEIAEVEVPLSTTPAKPQPAKPRVPSSAGKASKEVKDLINKSPGASASRTGRVPAPVPSTRVSLANTGNWNKEMFSEIKIIFPVLSTANESTNDLTRSSRPEARYWKGDIKFVNGSETSQTLRVFNVPVPFSDNVRYGSEFVYMCLPAFMSAAFADAGKTKRPTIINEPSLVPDSNRWWKIANNITDKFGSGNAQTKSFKPINVQGLLVGTQKGLIVNVELKFQAKASTTDKAKLTATNPQKIAVELVRAYIVSTDQDIELPNRVIKAKNTVRPGAAKEDFASDEVMQRLSSLGL